MSRHIVTMTHPASWHGELWREALPLGNGLTGVLMPGAIAEESIQFNRHDLWHDGNPGGEIPDISETFREMRRMIDEGDYASANINNMAAALQKNGYGSSAQVPHPLGWLTIHTTPETIFRHYRRGIDLRSGEAFVTYDLGNCSFRRQMFVSRDCDAVVMRMTADRPFTAIYDFKLFGECTTSTTSKIALRRFNANLNTAANVMFFGDFTSETMGNSLAVTGRDYTLFIRCSSHGSPLELDDLCEETYESLLKKHTDLHTPLYDSLSIEFGGDEEHLTSNEELLRDAYDDIASPALLERFWRFGRYLFLSAFSPAGTPIPLYGLWHGADHLPWSQFVANENVEMTYWNALVGGFSQSLPPLIRYYTSKIDKFRECARKLFGMNGIWISAYTTPDVAGVNTPVGVIINWISCAGWLCRHFWDYYQYSNDEAMLREEILPFMREAARFYLDYAVYDDTTGTTQLRLYPSVSPENTPLNLMHLAAKNPLGHPCPAVENATMDFAVMKELLTHLLQGIEHTGMYAEEAQLYRNALVHIPPYMINADGAVREWMKEDLADNYNHRHLSHLYPVFPGDEVTAHRDPALFDAFRRAVDLRELGGQSGWSLTHMANLYARMGMGEQSAECLDIMAKSVVNSVLLTTHNDWRHMGMTLEGGSFAPIQLDAAFGAVNAVQEMLFCPQNGALSLLPALPARLNTGSARGLAFPGGQVDLSWNEQSVSVTVRAERAVDTDILLFNTAAEHLTLAAGESKTMEFSR